MNRLDRLAARCAVPVFVAHGRDQAPAVERLSLTPGIRMMSTPRHASILLVAGQVRASERALLARIHDQLAHPRATLWWGAEPNANVANPRSTKAADNPESMLSDLYRDLLSGDYASEEHWLEDQPPNLWRGKGDHGQGGEGMMGGVPYGRMMPMPPTPDIRDGLALDIYTTQIGPFLPQWPPGLVLDITLQGDIVQSASIVSPPYPPADNIRAPFDRALHEPILLADIERARAAHHLISIACLAELVELPAQGLRCRRAAAQIGDGDTVDITTLRKTLRRAGMTATIPKGLGRIESSLARTLGGPVQRAAGYDIDTRANSALYAQLGFRPVTNTRSDSRARLDQWFDEAEQAMALVRRAPEATIEKGAVLETPWAHRAPPLDYRCIDMLPGLEWSEARLVLASFDAAALCRMAPLEAL